MSEIKNVIIVGAGGNLGPSILNAFLHNSSFHVSVLSREGSSSTFPEGVSVLRANYDSIDSLKAALKGQDVVISLVGGAAFKDQNKLIDGAVAAGVKRFIPSEFGSNTLDKKALEVVPIFQAKIDTVDYLKSKEDVISWTSVITGPFFDWGLKIGFLGFNASTKTATLIDEGRGQWSATNLHQIGLALIKSLEKPELTKNQYVYVESFNTNQKEILAVAEKVTGSKWNVENVSSNELVATGGEKLKKGDFSGIADLIKRYAFGEDNLGDNSPCGLWNDKLGLPKEDFEASVKAALEGKLYGQD